MSKVLGLLNVAGVRSQAVSPVTNKSDKEQGKREVQGNSRQVTMEIRQKKSQEGKCWKAMYEHTKRSDRGQRKQAGRYTGETDELMEGRCVCGWGR